MSQSRNKHELPLVASALGHCAIPNTSPPKNASWNEELLNLMEAMPDLLDKWHESSTAPGPLQEGSATQPLP